MSRVNWGRYFLDFLVSNGVRQEGVLRALTCLHYILMVLSTNLNAIKSGCIIGNALVNHLFFADDIYA